MNGAFQKIVLLFAVAIFSLCWFVSCCSADQKDLMDEWAKHKRQITERIVTKLREEGKLPQYGTIEFSARVKPLPTGDLEIVVDNLKVHPKEAQSGASTSKNLVVGGATKTTEDEAVARQFQEIFRPRNPAPYWTTGTIDISSGRVSGENFRIEKGKAEGQSAENNEKPKEENQQVKESQGKAINSTGRSETPSDTVSKESAEDKTESPGVWHKFLMWLLGKKEEGGKQ